MVFVNNDREEKAIFFLKSATVSGSKNWFMPFVTNTLWREVHALKSLSTYSHGKHGDRSAIDPLYRETRRFMLPAKPKNIQQGQVVIRRRDREHRVLP
jgi:hypothetical protein